MSPLMIKSVWEPHNVVPRLTCVAYRLVTYTRTERKERHSILVLKFFGGKLQFFSIDYQKLVKSRFKCWWRNSDNIQSFWWNNLPLINRFVHQLLTYTKLKVYSCATFYMYSILSQFLCQFWGIDGFLSEVTDFNEISHFRIWMRHGQTSQTTDKFHIPERRGRLGGHVFF